MGLREFKVCLGCQWFVGAYFAHDEHVSGIRYINKKITHIHTWQQNTIRHGNIHFEGLLKMQKLLTYQPPSVHLGPKSLLPSPTVASKLVSKLVSRVHQQHWLQHDCLQVRVPIFEARIFLPSWA